MSLATLSPQALIIGVAALLVLSGSVLAASVTTPNPSLTGGGATVQSNAPVLSAPINGQASPPGTSRAAGPVPTAAGAGGPSAVGNGNDWVGSDPSGTFGTASLTFSMTGFSSETDECPADESSNCGTRTETNGYSLQINSNRFTCNTAFTDGVSATCWEQFIYENCPNLSCIGASGYGSQENIYIEYWLLGFVTSTTPCSSLPSIPDGGESWNTFGNNCYADTTHLTATGVPPSDLADLDLSAVVTGSTDTVRLADSGCSGCDWSWTETDGVLDLSSHWTQSEGNVFGWNDASQATFNAGTTITVTQRFAPGDGQSSFTPGCLPGSGTTGETNNLFLNPCTTFADGLTFEETSSPPVSVVTTQVFDAITIDPWTTEEPYGTPAFDTAVVLGGSTPSGTVTYRFWRDSACTGSAAQTSTVTLVNGAAPISAATGPLGFGGFSFQAAYSGDANNVGSASACEPFGLSYNYVHFRTTGLRLTTPWWLCVSATLPACHPGYRLALDRSDVPTLNLTLSIGRYYYAVLTNGSLAAPGGFFTVGSSSPAINLTFAYAPKYPVTFTAAGLANSPDWDVWVSPSCLSGCNLTTGPITMMLPNGTYSYFPNSGSPTLGAPGGQFVVDGGPLSVPVAFGPAYPVTFAEKGLPPGVNWFVNVTNQPPMNSTGPSITQGLANGAYTYTVASSNKSWAPTAAKGSFGVNYSALVVPVDFHRVTYSVTWTLSGSGAGPAKKSLARYGWTAELGGVVQHATGSSVSFMVPNGSYDYLLTGPRGVELGGPGAPASGTILVGGNWSGVLAYAKGSTADLKFHERGLPKGTRWCAQLSGWVMCQTTTSAVFSNLTPSSVSGGAMPVSIVSPLYGESISAAIGKTALTLPGTISISRSTTVALTFAYRYSVVFTETGLASGVWSVTIKGQTETNASGDPIVFYLPNGTYSYNIGKITGLTALGEPKPLKVVGAIGSVSVTFVEKARR